MTKWHAITQRISTVHYSDAPGSEPEIEYLARGVSWNQALRALVGDLEQRVSTAKIEIGDQQLVDDLELAQDQAENDSFRDQPFSVEVDGVRFELRAVES